MTDLNQQISNDYFERLSAEYVKLIVESQRQIYRNINPVITRRVKGRVLSLGSGPVMNFGDTTVDHVVCLDLSFNMLAQLPPRPKLSRVCSDAQFLPFDIGTFDVVVIPFLIHHLAQDSVENTDGAVSRMLGESCRVLKRNGKIIIADLFISNILEVMERSVYGPATYILHRSMRPMMFFYSIANFTAMLSNCGLSLAFDQKIEMQEKIMPTLLFPNFKINAKWHPAKFHILEVTKFA